MALHARIGTRGQGFTMIEILITLLVVTILVGVAYPAYTEKLRSTRRADAIGALMSLANRESTFRANYNSYTVTLVAPSGCSGSACGLGFASSRSDGGYYTLSAAAGTAGIATSFVLSAAPRAGTDQASDKCGTLTLDQRGVQGVSGAASGVTAQDCW
jgi:type IV pilus assembly protein PilE